MMISKNIQPTEPQRDSGGWWAHPDYIPNLEEGALRVEFDVWLEVNSVECVARMMENDLEPESPVAQAWENGDCDCSAWNPQPPEGEGWFLVSVHDTEDGPCAVWLRKLPDAQPTTPYDALLRHYSPLFDERAKLALEVKSLQRRLEWASDRLTRCTCPSGDGSLRWPCPVHAPEEMPDAEELRFEIDHMEDVEACGEADPDYSQLICWLKELQRRRAAMAAKPVQAVSMPDDVRDSLQDSAYRSGVTAGWNAAQADDPNAALKKIQDAYEGHLKPLRDWQKAGRPSAASRVPDIDTILKTPFLEGETIFWQLVFGLQNSADDEREILAAEIVRAILAAAAPSSFTTPAVVVPVDALLSQMAYIAAYSIRDMDHWKKDRLLSWADSVIERAKRACSAAAPSHTSAEGK